MLPDGEQPVVDANTIAAHTLALYDTLKFKPPTGKFTILAAFLLSARNNLKVISLATGSKCLPTTKYSINGDSLHDSHAEVLARRGAVRWFLEETLRTTSESGSYASDWIEPRADGPGKFTLCDGVRVHLYVSTVPCGDASMSFLAAMQDSAMAALKDSVVFQQLPPNTPSRGRNNYALYGVLRTKPGRADSPPTLCMSCSDKIARWNVLGFQGAFASHFLEPLYISTVTIGEVESDMPGAVLADCTRAFHARLSSLDGKLPAGHRVNRTTILFTHLPFLHSAKSLGVSSSCNEALCWVADTPRALEVLINGLKRGIPPKHRSNPKFRPFLSKISLFNLHEELRSALGVRDPGGRTYHGAKQTAVAYQNAKTALLGADGPFAGWLISGAPWESFTTDSRVVAVDSPEATSLDSCANDSDLQLHKIR